MLPFGIIKRAKASAIEEWPKGIYKRPNTGIWWYGRMRKGKRVLVSLETKDYVEAIQKAKILEDTPEMNPGGLLEAEIERYVALSHLAYCEIRIGRIEEARNHLAEIDRLFPRLRKGITFALQCQLELRAGNPEEVLRRIDAPASKTNRFLETLRLGAIRGILTNPGLSDKRRLESQAEIKAAPVVSDEPVFGDLPR